MKKIYIAIIAFLIAGEVAAQNAKATKGSFLIKNATLITVVNDTLKNASLLIADGEIKAIGGDVSAPSNAQEIDGSGLYVYPGMIESGAKLGLTEVGSDARTRDFNEIGEVIPQMKALTAVNPNSVLIPVTRVSGVTSSLATPSGGLFSGTAALINLYGYTPDQMYAGFEGVVLNFPVSVKRSSWDRRSKEEIQKQVEENMKHLNETWEKAVAYAKIDSTMKASSVSNDLKYYPEMEALLPVVNGEQTLIVEVNAAADIKAAIAWLSDKDVKVVFSGVSEGWRMAEDLAKAKIPVIAGPVLDVPNRDYDAYDQMYTNPGLMLKAGVKVAIRTNDAENVRNLPYNAGFAAAYGMGKEEALKAVTIVPAEIFGVADKLGSLEKGKMANLFIADGDIFEPKTQVKFLFIGGYQIPLESRQTKLYDEFLERSPGVKK